MESGKQWGKGNCNCRGPKPKFLLAWELHQTQMTAQEKAQSKMVVHLKNNITTQGHKVINTTPTRIVGSTTDKENMIIYQNIYPTFIDHSLLVYRKRAKPQKVTRRFIRTRKITNFSRQQYKMDIKKTPPLPRDTVHWGPKPCSTKYNTNHPKLTRLPSPSPKTPNTPKNEPKISKEAREVLAGDARNIRHLRNRANKIISRENF